MPDYNTMTYAEGKRLLKQAAIDPAALWDSAKAWGQGALDTAGKHIGNAATAAAGSGVGQWAKDNLWDNKIVRDSLIGAGGGAALGGLSSLWQDEDERTPISRMLTGGILGGLGGAGVGAWEQGLGENTDKHVKEKLQDEKSKRMTQEQEYVQGKAVPKGPDAKPVAPTPSSEDMAKIPEVGKPYTQGQHYEDIYADKNSEGERTGKIDKLKGRANMALDATGVPQSYAALSEIASGSPDQNIATYRHAAIPIEQGAAAYGLHRLANANRGGTNPMGRVLYGEYAAPTQEARNALINMQARISEGARIPRAVRQATLQAATQHARAPGRGRRIAANTAIGTAAMAGVPLLNMGVDAMLGSETARARAEQLARYEDYVNGKAS